MPVVNIPEKNMVINFPDDMDPQEIERAIYADVYGQVEEQPQVPKPIAPKPVAPQEVDATALQTPPSLDAPFIVKEEENVQVAKPLREGIRDVIRTSSKFLGELLSQPSPDTQLRQDIRDFASRTALGEVQKPMVEYEGQKKAGESFKKLSSARALKPDEDYIRSSGWKGWVEDFIRTAPQIGTQIGATLLGGPMAGIGVMGAQIAGGTIENLMEQGINPERALNAGVANALIQTPLEQIGVGKLTKLLKPQRVFLKKLKDIGEAAGVEWLTEFVQAYPDMIINTVAANPDLTRQEQYNEVIDQLWETTKQGAYEGTLTAPWAFLGLAVPSRPQQQPKVQPVRPDISMQGEVQEEVKPEIPPEKPKEEPKVKPLRPETPVQGEVQEEIKPIIPPKQREDIYALQEQEEKEQQRLPEKPKVQPKKDEKEVKPVVPLEVKEQGEVQQETKPEIPPAKPRAVRPDISVQGEVQEETKPVVPPEIKVAKPEKPILKPKEEVKEKQTAIGTAWIGNQWKPIVGSTEIKRGKNKGKIRISLPQKTQSGRNKTKIVDADAVKFTEKKAEEEIEVVEKQKETEVKVEIPKQKEESLTPKEQKKYLLKEIDVAIKDQAEKFDMTVKEFGKVTDAKVFKPDASDYTFKIPGDGEFTIYGNQLFDFKKRAKSFPLNSFIKKPPTQVQKLRVIEKGFKKDIKKGLDKITPEDLESYFLGKDLTYSGAIAAKRQNNRQEIYDYLINENISDDLKQHIKEVVTGTKAKQPKAEDNLDLAELGNMDRLNKIKKRYPKLSAHDQIKLSRKIRELSTGEVGSPQPGEKVGKPKEWEKKVSKKEVEALKKEAKKAYTAGDLDMAQYMTVMDLFGKRDYDSINKILDLIRETESQNLAQKVKARGKANVGRLIEMIGSQMYQGNLADVTIKEVVQNSFDAVKASLNRGLEKEGKIDIITDPHNRIIAIKDNGQGMTSKVIQDAFLTVAGTSKESLEKGQASGGLGMAKAAFLYGNKWIEVNTASRGYRSRFKANSSELLNKDIEIDRQKVDKSEHGTVIIIKVPESVSVEGEEKTVWFPYDVKNIDFFQKPLIHGEIEVNASEQYLTDESIENLSNPDDKHWSNDKFNPLPVGKNMDLSKFSKHTTATFNWGKADIYISKKRNPRRFNLKHSILSAGIYQFDNQFNIEMFEPVPYDIIVNVFPDVKAESPSYPFNLKREGWKPTIKDDVELLEKYIRNVALGIQAQETVEQFKNIKSLPKVEVDKIGSEKVDISEFIKPKKTKKSERIFIPPEINVSGTKVTGKNKEGETVDYVDLDEEKKKEKAPTKFETDTKVKEAKEFLVDMGIDDSQPIYHNNTNVDYFEVAKEAGLSAETFFAEIGSLLLRVKDVVVDKSLYGYNALQSKDRPFFFGISIDKSYHGVSLVVPFNGVLFNPLAVKSQSLPGLVLGYYDTILHEISHVKARSHDKSFISTMSDLNVAMAEDGSDIEIRVALSKILKKHKNLINILRDKYEESTTQNLAKSLHKSDKDAGVASRRTEDGPFRYAERDAEYTPDAEQRRTERTGGVSVSASKEDRRPSKKREPSKGFDWDVKQGYASSGEYATNVKTVMELPEIVRLAKALLGGKYPNVKKRLRGRGVTGKFYPRGEGRIDLLASIFANPGQAEATLAHEIGHLVDYLPDHLMKRGNILGRMASLKRHMKHSIPRMPGGPGELTAKDRRKLRYQAQKLAKKEAGERWIDEVIKRELPITPEDVLAIWNAVDSAKMINADLLNYIKGLNTAQKKAVVKDAMKGIVRQELKRFVNIIEEKTGKKVKVKLSEKELKDLISKKYADLINQELEKRKLFDLETITEELKSLTRAWKPFDPEADSKYTKYRYSSPELYADAFSALLNAPGLLKSHAPNFYEGFFNYLERKPQVKQIYEKIQDSINNGDVDTELISTIKKRYRRGDRAYALAYEKKKELLDGLKREFIDAHHFIIKKVKTVGENNVPATENPRYKIEQMQYSGSEAEWYIKGDWQIVKRLEDVGLTWDDFGMRLELDRVKGERAEYANPDGITPSRARKLLKEFDEKRTPEQKAAMDYALEKFGKLRKYVIDKAEEAGIWDDKLIEMMRNTPEYATFDVIDYIEERHGAGPTSKIYEQVGTLKDIANPATATMLKDIAIIKAVNKQVAAKSVVDFLKKNFSDEIKPADKKWNGKFQEIRKPRDKELGLIVYLDKGKAKGYYVNKWIASSFDKNPIEGKFIAKVLSNTIQPFRMAFVELNYGFWMFNLFRDYFRALSNLPKAKARKFVPEYLRGIKHGMKSAFGIPDGVVGEMLKNNMLISIADVRGMRPEDKQIERMLRMYHMKPATWNNKIIKPFGKMFTYFSNVGRGFERGTKVASYLYLKKHFPDMTDTEIGHLVRTFGGSPDFLRQGSFSPVYNNIMMFSNAIKEGYRGDYEAFSRSPAEFMWKKAKYTYIPKLIMYAASVGLLGSMTKAIMEGVSEYDKTNYTIIPLWVTENGKSVYLRIPVDETSRLMGGVLWKALSFDKDKMTTGLVDYMAGQAPTVHPGIDILRAVVQYASGLNPYDHFRGRYAIPDQVFKAGGARSHKAFVKWLANKSGATIAYRFGPDDVDKIKTDLEKVIGYPISSNILGRFIKVSDAGIREDLRNSKLEKQQKRTREILDVKDAVYKWLNGEQLSQKEADLIEQNPDIVDRASLKALSRKYGNVFLEEILTASSTEEKGAVFNKWIERQNLLKKAQK